MPFPWISVGEVPVLDLEYLVYKHFILLGVPDSRWGTGNLGTDEIQSLS